MFKIEEEETSELFKFSYTNLNLEDKKNQEKVIDFFKTYDLNADPRTNHKIQMKFDINLSFCAELGYLDAVRFLLLSKDIPFHANIHANNDAALRHAYENSHFDIAKYLLSSPELKEHANIHAKNDEIFRFACYKGNLDMVKYLTSSPDLKEHVDIYTNNSEAFLAVSCYDYYPEIMKYFIFDLNMQLNDNVKETLSAPQYLEAKEEVEGWIQLRDLKNELDKNLPVGSEDNKKKMKM